MRKTAKNRENRGFAIFQNRKTAVFKKCGFSETLGH
jgi:hypothetical protein